MQRWGRLGQVPERIGVGPDLRVGQSRMRAEHRRIELVAAELAVPGDRHLAHDRQPIDIRVERADAVRELLRQHRDHAARKIDRGAALARLDVERIGVLHVVADIRDGDPETKAALLARAVDRVVEVLRGLAIDGDELERAQIAPAANIVRTNLVRK